MRTRTNSTKKNVGGGKANSKGTPQGGVISPLLSNCYLWTDKGWLYLAIVLDLFNREVVGWSLKPRMTADMRFRTELH